MAEADPRSLAELIAGLARDIPDLLGKEVELAKAEARRALELLLSALGRLALGSVVGIGAVGVALAALVSGLSALLISRGVDPALAGTLSATIVTLVAALVASLLFWSAVRALRAARASLESGVGTITESAARVMEKF
jgi:hypothetical protein